MSRGTLWIGDIEPYMDEAFLKQAFASMGEMCFSAKIIANKLTGLPVGYGFLEFIDEATAHRVLHHCDGKLIPGSNPEKRFRLNYASHSKDQAPQNAMSGQPPSSHQDYHNMYQNYQNYNYQNYYSPWQNYQQYYQNYQNYQGYPGYPGYYGQQGEYGQQPDAPRQANYDQYNAVQAEQQQQPQLPAPPQPQDQQPQPQYAAPDIESEFEDHEFNLDVKTRNELAIARNEEFYLALDSSRWLPTEGLDPPLVPVK